MNRPVWRMAPRLLAAEAGDCTALHAAVRPRRVGAIVALGSLGRPLWPSGPRPAASRQDHCQAAGYVRVSLPARELVLLPIDQSLIFDSPLPSPCPIRPGA